MTRTVLASSTSSLAWGAAAWAVAACVATSPAQAQAPFSEPRQAADALVAAVEARDNAALARVLGPQWRTLLPPEGVAPEDRDAFLEKARQSTTVNVKDGHADVVVGTDAWVLPIPLLQGWNGRWRFDMHGAREALLERRIGDNEHSAIQASLAYLDAQREYALADRDGDGLLEYAQKLISTPGRRDGLIWSQDLGDDSPLGEDYLPKDGRQGYHGYRFKILTGQGTGAQDGARTYVIGKRMIAGFGLLAWPLDYGRSGVMSFIVNQDGVVYERDLGPQTSYVAAGMQRFDPDGSWNKAK